MAILQFPKLPDHQWVKHILGDNFIGIREQRRAGIYAFSKKEISDLDHIPFSRLLVADCAETHILVAVPPISIAEMREKFPGQFSSKILFQDPHGYHAAWIHGKEAGAVWVLMRKTAIPESFGKSLDEQKELLDSGEYVPNVREAVYGILAFYNVHQLWLCTQRRGRTATYATLSGQIAVSGGPIELFPTDPHAGRFIHGLLSARYADNIRSRTEVRQK